MNRSNLGYYVGKGRKSNNLVSHSFFVDDLKLFASNEKQLNSLLETVATFSRDIGMSFGLDKCAKLTITKGKRSSTENVQLSTGDLIKELENEATYKYLGLNEDDNISHTSMKENLEKEYLTRVRKVLKSDLNSSNKIKAINTWAMPSLTYGYGVIKWSVTDLETIDTRTRKLLTMNSMFHKKSDITRLYMQRSEGGRGLLSASQQYKKAIINLAHHIENSKDKYIKIVKEWDAKESDSIMKKAQKYAEELNLNLDDLKSKTKLQCKSTIKEASLGKLKEKLRAKPLHGQFHQMIEQGHIDKKATFEWMKGTGLKGGTEATIVAIQEQAVTTRYIKKHIHKTTDSDTCRMCNTMPETIAHVVSGCTTLAATSYLKRHNSVAKIIHLELAKKFNLIEVKETLKWYSYTPEKVLENESSKLLWDFQINTDRTIIASKPDIIFQDKKTNKLYLIDIAIPADANIVKKRIEKIDKYIDLSIELKRLWNASEVLVIPIVIGATGVISKSFKQDLEKIPCKISQLEMQKAALLGTMRIVRRFTQIEG